MLFRITKICIFYKFLLKTDKIRINKKCALRQKAMLTAHFNNVWELVYFTSFLPFTI